MFRKPIFEVILFSIILISCRSSRPVVSPATANGSSASYIENYKDMAVREMVRTGIPASITLAQGMIESGNGKSRLAAEANNHFGIKCHNDWKGATVRHHDDSRNECFRKYKTPEESYRDHSDFLSSTPRYRSLFELEPTDYIGWAKELKKAGYATNPDYSNMLIRKIEEYGLHKYDNMQPASVKSGGKISSAKKTAAEYDSIPQAAVNYAPAEPVYYLALPARVKENNRIQYIIVNEQDTRSSIEKEFGLLPWELQKYNELEEGFSVTPGQILYIQPKRQKAEAGKEYHIVKEGETLYMISQIYGIKLQQIYIMNMIDEGTEPGVGNRLRLR